MGALTWWLVFLAALVPTWPVGSAEVYSPPICKSVCSNENEFEEPLPLEPDVAVGNRATQWGIVMLNQVKANSKGLSPPGVARCLALFSACLHDTLALETEGMKTGFIGERVNEARIDTVIERKDGDDDDVFSFSIGTSANGFVLDSSIDGAAFEALKSIFGDKDSFKAVAKFALEAAGQRAPQQQDIDEFKQSDILNLLDENGHESYRLGQRVCDEVIRDFYKDGFTPEGYPEQGIESTYTPTNSPQVLPGITNCKEEMKSMDRWQPLCTPLKFGSKECTVQEFLAPLAGEMLTFGIVDGKSISPAQGPPLIEGGQERQWRDQAAEVLAYSANLTDATKLIAEHWADGPDSTFPPGHWYRIAMDASLNMGLDTVETVKVMFLVGNALNDAGVAAWASKVRFDSVRPLQMIQCGFAGQTSEFWQGPYMGVGSGDPAVWQPYQKDDFVTPPFAGFVSGHSTFSAAAGQVLMKRFGPEYRAKKCRRIQEGESVFEKRIRKGEEGFIKGVTNRPNRGPKTKGYVPADDVVLCWNTWEAAAEDAGLSRLHGGIHIIADHTEGVKMGAEIATRVFEKATKLWV